MLSVQHLPSGAAHRMQGSAIKYVTIAARPLQSDDARYVRHFVLFLGITMLLTLAGVVLPDNVVPCRTEFEFRKDVKLRCNKLGSSVFLGSMRLKLFSRVFLEENTF